MFLWQLTIQAKKAAEEASKSMQEASKTALEASKTAAGVSKNTFEDLTYVSKSTFGDLTKSAKEAAAKKGLLKVTSPAPSLSALLIRALCHLHILCVCVPETMSCSKRKPYVSVAVPPAPVQVFSQWALAPSVMSVS